MKRHMLFLGFGYTAQALACKLDRTAWLVSGTSRTAAGLAKIETQDVRGIAFDKVQDMEEDITHIVSSVPPDADGDPVIRTVGKSLVSRRRTCQWIAYLSTTGVYGDHAGGWVDEATPLTPNTERGRRRAAAERDWLGLYVEHDLPVHIFRIAGIYGPGRNVLESLRTGTAKRVIRPGQVFSRVHVDDIAGVLQASLARPNPGSIYNVTDDEPCPPQDVVTFGAALLNLAPPPETSFSDAVLSPMAASFYEDSKRVRNIRIKEELGYQLRYPSYRDGLRALL